MRGLGLDCSQVSSFQITPENFFSLARLADKFIIPHLTSLLTYFSHTLIATTKPSYDLWLAAARHDMVERNLSTLLHVWKSLKFSQKKGSVTLSWKKGVSPAALDGIIMDLMKLKDNYIAFSRIINVSCKDRGSHTNVNRIVRNLRVVSSQPFD